MRILDQGWPNWPANSTQLVFVTQIWLLSYIGVKPTCRSSYLNARSRSISISFSVDEVGQVTMENEVIYLPLHFKGVCRAKRGRFEFVLHDADVRTDIIREVCAPDIDRLGALFSSIPFPFLDVIYALTVAAFFMSVCRATGTVEVKVDFCLRDIQQVSCRTSKGKTRGRRASSARRILGKQCTKSRLVLLTREHIRRHLFIDFRTTTNEWVGTVTNAQASCHPRRS
ncbi:hypothetical protein BS17DRAFT_166669 [Gyrodon lividus]|nr:hypothetical protein BS17DRAFT_166669 [Gyrodon lividus]